MSRALWFMSFATVFFSACGTSSQFRIGGQPVSTDDGAAATHEYYAPQLKRLKKQPAPLPMEVVFAMPNPQFAAANWVKGKERLSEKQLAFFRDFTVTSWQVLGGALEKGGVFQGFRKAPTLTGTSELEAPSKIKDGTLVIGFNAANRVVVYPHPDSERGLVIQEGLPQGNELETMTNLVIAATRRLSRELAAAPAPAPIPSVEPKTASAGIVAVFDVQSSRVKLAKGLRGSLANFAAAHLAASGRYRVIPRSQIRARLLEEKRASYRACVDEACQLEIGRELAAQKSLAITIAKIGSDCSVSAVLYDLKQAASEQAATASGACTEDGFLAAIRNTVDEITGAHARK